MVELHRFAPGPAEAVLHVLLSLVGAVVLGYAHSLVMGLF